MKRFFAAAGLALVAVVLFSGAVFGHSRPILFDPAPGAVLSTAPAQVTGWFTSEIRRDANWSFLRVTDQQGAQVDVGETTVSADRRQMTVNLRSGLGPGRYIVTWRTFDDADGEIFGDCYTFFIGQAAADAAVTDKTRLDGGSACQRIEISTRNGTPVPGQTPTASNGREIEGEEPAEGSDSGGVATWMLILGIAGGLAGGLAGGRLIGGRS